jgi:hypothetical protein
MRITVILFKECDFDTVEVIALKRNPQFEAMPSPENVSLEPILKLLPHPKKVSVIIFVLIWVLFCSLVMNVKQRKDFNVLETQYIQTQTDDCKENKIEK